MVGFLWTLLLLSFLILIHELGHFLAAKWQGIEVEEFGLGYPPRLFVLFRRWNTDFSLNMLPLGGFVRLFGDDGETAENLPLALEPEASVAGKSKAGAKKAGRQAFFDQPVKKRLVVILAGIVVNFLFGVIAFSLLFSSIGIPEKLDHVRATMVESGSPADTAGIKVDDEILSVASKELGKSSPQNSTEFITAIAVRRGQEVELEVVRGADAPKMVTTRVRTAEETPAGGGSLGIGVDDMKYAFYPWWQMPARGMYVGFFDSLAMGKTILLSLGDLVSSAVRTGTVPKDLAGPIGIVDQTVQSGILESGWPGRFNWLALISVNLAFMNLLPIPALDGGRALFLLLEPLIGRARRQRYEARANLVGMMFLLGLVLIISAKDVWQIWIR